MAACAVLHIFSLVLLINHDIDRLPFFSRSFFLFSLIEIMGCTT